MAEIEITAMTFGPYGLGHFSGKTVMVAGAVPGDLVDASIVADRGNYLLARTDRVLRGGTSRRQPPCRWLPQCGGCDWQHLEYAAQLRLKGELIAAEFKRGLGFEVEPDKLVEPASAEFGYRARIRLKLSRDGTLGYFAMGSNKLIAIDHCLVAASELIPAEFAAHLRRNCREIEVAADGNQAVLVVELTGTPSARAIAVARAAVETDARIKGIILRGGGQRLTTGDCSITVEPEPGCEIIAEADNFNQVNREQNQKLVAAVLAMTRAGDAVVLDLFCGVGNFSLPFARRGAKVTGADSDASAIAAASHNADRMALRDVGFMAMPAIEAVRFLERAHYRPDVIILDPPRTGAPLLIEPMLRLQPKTVIYVSCDCATLVRDLKAVRSYGYDIAQVRAFDFFPNTHHAEVAVRALLT
jgi:23S rRNA (uracil1939-C5)-methyltransferase